MLLTVFPSGRVFISKVDAETRGFPKGLTKKSVFNVYDQSPCCVVYRLYNKRMENNSCLYWKQGVDEVTECTEI